MHFYKVNKNSIPTLFPCFKMKSKEFGPDLFTILHLDLQNGLQLHPDGNFVCEILPPKNVNALVDHLRLHIGAQLPSGRLVEVFECFAIRAKDIVACKSDGLTRHDTLADIFRINALPHIRMTVKRGGNTFEMIIDQEGLLVGKSALPPFRSRSTSRSHADFHSLFIEEAAAA